MPTAAVSESVVQDQVAIAPWRSPFRYWVWLIFAVNAMITLVFAILCATVYEGFLDLIYKLKEAEGDRGLPPATAISGILLSDWQSLFWGAATSAIFAFVVSALFHASTLLMLLCSFKSLGHPGRRFGRGFVIAASAWSSLHILNITLQFKSYAPIMVSFNTEQYNDQRAEINMPLLKACIAFGFISTVLYFLFALLVLFWRERPELMQVELSGRSQQLSASV